MKKDAQLNLRTYTHWEGCDRDGRSPVHILRLCISRCPCGWIGPRDGMWPSQEWAEKLCVSYVQSASGASSSVFAVLLLAAGID